MQQTPVLAGGPERGIALGVIELAGRLRVRHLHHDRPRAGPATFENLGVLSRHDDLCADVGEHLADRHAVLDEVRLEVLHVDDADHVHGLAHHACDTRRMSHEQSRTIMSTYLDEVLGKRRFDLVAELAADDMVDHTQPHLSAPLRSTHTLVASARTRGSASRSAQDHRDRDVGGGYLAMGRRAASPDRSVRLGRSGDPASVASVFEIEDGRIVEYRAFVDAVDVFTQMAQ